MGVLRVRWAFSCCRPARVCYASAGLLRTVARPGCFYASAGLFHAVARPGCITRPPGLFMLSPGTGVLRVRRVFLVLSPGTGALRVRRAFSCCRPARVCLRVRRAFSYCRPARVCYASAGPWGLRVRTRARPRCVRRAAMCASGRAHCRLATRTAVAPPSEGGAEPAREECSLSPLGRYSLRAAGRRRLSVGAQCTGRCSRVVILGRVVAQPAGRARVSVGRGRNATHAHCVYDWEGAVRLAKRDRFAVAFAKSGHGWASASPGRRFCSRVHLALAEREGVPTRHCPPRGFSCDAPCGARGDLPPRRHARATLLVGLATAQVLSGARPSFRLRW